VGGVEVHKGCGVEVDVHNTQFGRLWVEGIGTRGVLVKREGSKALVHHIYEISGSQRL